jgi:hypothetical protein
MRLSPPSGCAKVTGDGVWVGKRSSQSTLRHVLALIGLVVSLAIAGHGRAASVTRPPPDGIVLDSRLTGAIDVELRETLVELLGRLRLRIIAARGRDPDAVLAFVSIEPSAGGASVTVVQTRPPNSRVRRRVENAASPELFREALAHVILGALEPLLELREEAPTPPATPAAADRTTALEDSRSTSPSWSIGVRAGALWFVSEQASAAVVGGAGAVTFEVPLRPSVALEVGYMLPLLITRDGVLAEFSLVSARARPGLELASSETLALRLDLAAGFDFVALSPRQAIDVTAVSRSTRLQPMLGGGLGAHLRLWDTLELVARVGVDIDLAPRHWVIESGAAQSSFFETARGVPYLTLGIDWSPRADVLERTGR